MKITFASSKGGVGKSTACLVTGCYLAGQGGPVLIIDMDPNSTIGRWSKRASVPGVAVQSCNLDQFSDTFEQADASGAYAHILMDVPGFMNTSTLRAATRADLVVIPCTKSEPDLTEAIKTAKHVDGIGRDIGRAIPWRFLLNRVAPLPSHTDKWFDEQLFKGRRPFIQREMIERRAYKDIFAAGTQAHLTDPKAAAEVAEIVAAMGRAIEEGAVSPQAQAANVKPPVFGKTSEPAQAERAAAAARRMPTRRLPR